MAEGESTYPQDWLRIAGQDLERVRRRLEDGDIEDAAFRLQQALEKYLKGYLLMRGWQLQRTHDLVTLLTAAVKHDRTLERFRDLCRKTSGYYIVERYPMVDEWLSERDVRSTYQQAKRFVRALLPSSPRTRGKR